MKFGVVLKFFSKIKFLIDVNLEIIYDIEYIFFL